MDVYKYDWDGQQSMLNAKPWARDPNFFNKVRISALALTKMVMHAKSGGSKEIMGLMLGKIDANVMIIVDAFALPVEGTETRVNAQAQGYEYMTEYIVAAKRVGRLENAIGWYHSHPGYGCWLSGIDVSTQMLNQSYQDPFVAIVIDPTRTLSSGTVDIGAFRTYPKGYEPPPSEKQGHSSAATGSDGIISGRSRTGNGVGASREEFQAIPLDKIEDFGVHCNSYYQLTIEYYKSPLDAKLIDALWSRYWVNTLTTPDTSANLFSRHLADADQQAQNKFAISRMSAISSWLRTINSSILDQNGTAEDVRSANHVGGKHTSKKNANDLEALSSAALEAGRFSNTLVQSRKWAAVQRQLFSLPSAATTSMTEDC